MFRIQRHETTRFALIALTAATFATPALASAVRVDYSDLNLQSHDGAKVMLARLNAAAHQACGPAPVIRALGQYDEYRACAKHSLGKAVAALNAPLVTAAAHGGTEATSRTVAAAGAPR